MALMKAKVIDSTHLELSEPIAACKGLIVLVSVAETGDADVERDEWLNASGASLQAAYGDSEPEYPVSMVKETNPDYGT